MSRHIKKQELCAGYFEHGLKTSNQKVSICILHPKNAWVSWSMDHSSFSELPSSLPEATFSMQP